MKLSIQLRKPKNCYDEPINLEPHLGQVMLEHGVPRVCVTVYPQLGHLQEAGPPIPCLCPPLPLPNPRPILIFIVSFL
ncbi:MAG: hypothetical protein JW815_06410 [Candidatus Bathyarchaeota archaeon]|nr:hypothetical protein [Candidatus Bathyarchaeum sp.]